jgi:hypothetical protein
MPKAVEADPTERSHGRTAGSAPRARRGAEGRAVLGIEAGGNLAAATAVLPRAATLDDGEIVLLKIRPSHWFILLSGRWSWPLLAVAAVVAYMATALQDFAAYRVAAAQCVAGAALLRLAWAVYLWATRWYVLTNRRVMWLAGGLRPLEFVALLTQVREVAVQASAGQQLVGLGTVMMPTRRKDEMVLSWHYLRNAEQIAAQVRHAVDAAGNNHAGQ